MQKSKLPLTLSPLWRKRRRRRRRRERKTKMLGLPPLRIRRKVLPAWEKTQVAVVMVPHPRG